MPGTKQWFRNLAKTDPEHYREIFAQFKSETKGKIGRGHKKQFQIMQYKESETRKQEFSLTTPFEEMSPGRYIQYFTEEVPVDERLNEAEARLSWVRDRASGTFEKAGLALGNRNR